MAEGFRAYTEETHSAQSIDGTMGCSSRLLFLDLGARLVLNSAGEIAKQADIYLTAELLPCYIGLPHRFHSAIFLWWISSVLGVSDGQLSLLFQNLY